jgi:hypothetical protein
MSDRLHLATRKGLFLLERGHSGWTIASTSFLGDPVTLSLSDGRDNTLYAALNLGHFGAKLQRSSDGGSTWEEVAVPVYPKAEGPAKEEEKKAPSLKQIWALAAGGKDEPGCLWAGTIPGGLFSSKNRGESWELVRPLWDRPEREAWMGGGYDEAGIHSVCVDPRDSRRILVGVSVGGVWVTEDGGKSWALSAKGMRAAYIPPERALDENMQDPHLVVQCAGAPDVYWCQHHNGVFRSVDGARTWEELEVPPSSFGFAVAVHPKEPETAWLVPAVKDECRIPVDGKVVVARTRDGGKSFQVMREGLPQVHAYDLVFRHALDVDDTGERLAMGSTTGSVWVSEDQGDSWQTVSHHLPPVYSVRFER